MKHALLLTEEVLLLLGVLAGGVLHILHLLHEVILELLQVDAAVVVLIGALELVIAHVVGENHATLSSHAAAALGELTLVQNVVAVAVEAAEGPLAHDITSLRCAHGLLLVAIVLLNESLHLAT